jgi:nucleoside-diphosphate-sugar epimerase
MVLSAKLLRFEPILTSSNWGYTITKANEKLGYEPNFDLKTGINKTAQSYVKLG